MDERLESSWHLVYYQLSREPRIAGCSCQSDIYLEECGLVRKLIHWWSPRNFIFRVLNFRGWSRLRNYFILTVKFSRSMVVCELPLPGCKGDCWKEGSLCELTVGLWTDTRILVTGFCLLSLQQEVISALPKFIKLSPGLVKGVFDRLLVSYKGMCILNLCGNLNRIDLYTCALMQICLLIFVIDLLFPSLQGTRGTVLVLSLLQSCS